VFLKRHSNGSRQLPQGTLNGPLDIATIVARVNRAYQEPVHY